MRKRLSMTIATLALAIAPSIASADGYFVPFIGANFGGEVGRPLSESRSSATGMTYGFGVGGMVGGIFGVEFDLGYTHNFYATDGAVATKRQPADGDALARHRHSHWRSDRWRACGPTSSRARGSEARRRLRHARFDHRKTTGATRSAAVS